MPRPATRCLLVTLTALLLAAPLRAEGEGQADLDQATELKITAEGLEDLNRVITLLESSIEKGLDEANAEFAERMLAATLMQRAGGRANLVLSRPAAGARRNTQWIQARQSALTDLQWALELDETLVEAHLMIARLNSLEPRNPTAARRALNKAIAYADANPDSEAINNEQLAQAYALRGAMQSNEEKRLADFNRAVELTPSKAEHHLLRSRVYAGRQEWDAALADIDKAAELAPDNHVVFEEKGKILRAQEKLEEAIAALDKATEIEPQAMVPYQLRGELYHLLGDTDRAIDELTRAMEIKPTDLASPLIRAELYSANEQYELALADVEAFLRRQPALLRAHLMRVALLSQLGRQDDAIAVLERLAEAAPQQTELRLQLASFYMNAGRHSDAIDALTRVIDAGEDDQLPLRMRGDNYLSIGKHEEALADFEQSYELNPEDEGLLNNFAWTLATSPFDELRNGSRAIELATKACELTEYEAAYILSTLAAAYAEAGDFEKAIEWSQKAVDMHAGNEDKTRDMTEELAAELASYKAGQPWRELKEEAGPATGDDAPSDEPLADGPPPAASLDF